MIVSPRRENLAKPMDVNNWQSVEHKQEPQRLNDQRRTVVDGLHGNTYPCICVLGIYKWLLTLALCAAVVSIPWEFMRLYQQAVADRASKIVQGAPPECNPENLTLFEKIKSLLVAQFSWSHSRSPCQEYYYALLVDPLWEVTPAMVLISAFTRCCLHPLELISASLGSSLQLFFSQIPFQWQPFCFLVASVIIIVLLVMLCGYRLSIPLILRLESRSPSRIQTFVRNDNYQDEIAGRNNRNISSYERTYSAVGDNVSERTSLRPLSRISSEDVLNRNQYFHASKSGKDCRNCNSEENLYSSTSKQPYVRSCSEKRSDSFLRGSVNKKQNGGDNWEIPVSDILTGKTHKEKHQALYKSQTAVVIKVIGKGKNTAPLNSRKSNMMKKKSKLDSLWMPKGEDYISSDSE